MGSRLLIVGLCLTTRLSSACFFFSFCSFPPPPSLPFAWVPTPCTTRTSLPLASCISDLFYSEGGTTAHPSSSLVPVSRRGFPTLVWVGCITKGNRRVLSGVPDARRRGSCGQGRLSQAADDSLVLVSGVLLGGIWFFPSRTGGKGEGNRAWMMNAWALEVPLTV